MLKQNVKSTMMLVLGVLQAWALLGLPQSVVARELDTFKLVATVDTPGTRQEVKSWAWTELGRLKKMTAHEKDPLTGKVAKSQGFLLSHLVDKALEGLPLESRAQIDLIVVTGLSGQKALIPRALASKYPLMVAMHSSFDAQETQGLLSLVVPWTSKPKIHQEDLPLNSFFVRNLAQIELTNYRHRFGGLFLKRRTDPSAMRGEKLFVQSCTCCHNAAKAQPPAQMTQWMQSAQSEIFGTKGHPSGSPQLKLTDRDRSAIVRYSELLGQELHENTTKIIVPDQGSKSL
jgi:hypothetical protein